MKKSITFFVLFALIFIGGCTPGEQVSGSPAPQYRISEEIVVYSDAKWTQLGNHELVEQYSEEKHYMETDAPKSARLPSTARNTKGNIRAHIIRAIRWFMIYMCCGMIRLLRWRRSFMRRGSFAALTWRI